MGSILAGLHNVTQFHAVNLLSVDEQAASTKDLGREKRGAVKMNYRVIA